MKRKLVIQDLFSLEDYSKIRESYRCEILAHKSSRSIVIGNNIRLLFEDRRTIQYQIQEMLRVEKIFEKQGIQDELDTYNPLIPDGNNWKATMLIEYSEQEQRQKALALLVGIEDLVWVKIGDAAKLFAIADEDLDRSTSEKTSSVHFLRFELLSGQAKNLDASIPIVFGIDHKNYQYETNIFTTTKESIIKDLDQS
ncbi:MAG: hypothetical protein CMD78_04330 [Gammaproteobacteria bacterium]|nr:hypothetical protein [Gammaproteobacteria bacterium]